MNSLSRIGIILTALYFGFISFLILSRWDEFKALQLNALGDFIAGSFGPPTLIWVIVSFYLQGKELKNSVEALRLQAEELGKSVKHQEILAISAQDQIVLDREMMEFERQRLAEASRPYIQVKTMRFPMAPSTPKYRIELRNTGATIENVTLTVRTGGVTNGPYEVGSIPGSSTEKFPIEPFQNPNFGTDEVAKEFLRVDLIVEGVDLRDAPYVRSFQIPSFSMKEWPQLDVAAL